MRLFHTLLLLISLMTTINAAIWREENIHAMRLMRDCFPKEHVALFTKLFPVASVQRERREAMAFDYLGRLLKSGVPFCMAYAKMVAHGEQTITSQMRQAPQEDQHRWQQTLAQFQTNGIEARGQCDAVTVAVKAYYEGPLAPIHTCLSPLYQNVAKQLIMAQYREEEQGFY